MREQQEKPPLYKVGAYGQTPLPAPANPAQLFSSAMTLSMRR